MAAILTGEGCGFWLFDKPFIPGKVMRRLETSENLAAYLARQGHEVSGAPASNQWNCGQDGYLLKLCCHFISLFPAICRFTR